MSDLTPQASNKRTIPPEEITLIGYNFDTLGKVFFWQNRVFRAIYPEQTDYLRELFACGLLKELSEKALFPKTMFTDYQLEGFALVIEHEAIYPSLNPPQWSFAMLKAAALCVLEVNQIAQKYGYQTIDCHGFNVLFRHTKPVFIDLGSFIKVNPKLKSWYAYEQFRQCYYYPLKIQASGNFHLARLLLNRAIEPMPHHSYYFYRYKIARLFSAKQWDFFWENFCKYKLLADFSDEEIKEKIPAKWAKWLIFLRNKRLLPFQKLNLKTWQKRVEKMPLPQPASAWGDYHEQFRTGALPKRFEKILDAIGQLPVKSVLEIAGNQGIFAQLMQEHCPNLEQIICSDYDETAANIMYEDFSRKNLPITPAVLNFRYPDAFYAKPLTERLQSDLVVALALTHHLILTQKMPLEDIFGRFAAFSKGYVLTEFMPLGLYSPQSKRPYTPPKWYSLEWFRQGFSQYFEVIEEVQTEKNRILLIGKKLKPSD